MTNKGQELQCNQPYSVKTERESEAKLKAWMMRMKMITKKEKMKESNKEKKN